LIPSDECVPLGHEEREAMHQKIHLLYHVDDPDHAPSDIPILIDRVYHSDLGEYAGYTPDGIGSGACHRRIELDRIFTREGWHFVSDAGNVLTYEGTPPDGYRIANR
jgi:hypothetical protein